MSTADFDAQSIKSFSRDSVGASTDSQVSHFRVRVASAGRKLKVAKAYAVSTVKEPRILIGRKQYLLLLSHPRGYTSLIAHVLGSHPEVVGSCESYNPLPNGWHLLRLRYLTYWLNANKCPKRYVFDKILTSNIPVANQVLARRDVTVFFSVRRPEETIASQIRMGHEPRFKGQVYQEDGWEGWERHQDASYAVDFYIKRLRRLEEHCLALRERSCYYFDADDLIARTSDLLRSFERELALKEPLREEYQTFRHTGVASGDCSQEIRSGAIDRKRPKKIDVPIPEARMEQARAAYEHCRSLMRARCLCL
jgi:hypothetical protein